MDKSIRELAPSLVGGSIDFSFKKKLDGATSIDENIDAEKRKIARNVSLAFEVGGNLCVTLLAEMVSYYSKEVYYMAVRGSIQMRRYRPLVLKYLEKSINEREEHLLKILSTKKNRDAKVEAVKYFLATYRGRIRPFRGVLTKEEFMFVI